MGANEYRALTETEIERLEAADCTADDWSSVRVKDGFDAGRVRDVAFSGDCRLGVFAESFVQAGGVRKPAGIYHATLHAVTVGDNVRISNVRSYIANYDIGERTHIGNVDKIYVDGPTSFGNGVEVSVLNETGGREVTIHDALTAQEAYLEAMYRHRPNLIANLKRMARCRVDRRMASRGVIGSGVTIVDTGADTERLHRGRGGCRRCGAAFERFADEPPRFARPHRMRCDCRRLHRAGRLFH